VSLARSTSYVRAPFARRFAGLAGRRALWIAAVVMVAFGVAELPALARMSSHGTGVLGFEFAGTTQRVRVILTRWGSEGLAGARQHVLIDLGFIVGYGVLLLGVCARLSGRFQDGGHARAAAAAALLAWAVLIAAAVNALQKLVLWFETHGHVGQPLPALAAACGGMTLALTVSAALFAIFGTLVLRRMPFAQSVR